MLTTPTTVRRTETEIDHRGKTAESTQLPALIRRLMRLNCRSDADESIAVRFLSISAFRQSVNSSKSTPVEWNCKIRRMSVALLHVRCRKKTKMAGGAIKSFSKKASRTFSESATQTASNDVLAVEN